MKVPQVGPGAQWFRHGPAHAQAGQAGCSLHKGPPGPLGVRVLSLCLLGAWLWAKPPYWCRSPHRQTVPASPDHLGDTEEPATPLVKPCKGAQTSPLTGFTRCCTQHRALPHGACLQGGCRGLP